MNLQFYLEKLFASKKFQNFIKENTNAFFCSGFFVVDRQKTEPLATSSKLVQSKEGKDRKIHLDYFVPETKKMFSFQLEKNVEVIPVEHIESVPEIIPDNINFDFEEIERVISDTMKEKNIKSKIQKILISLQNLRGKSFLICTVFVSGLGLIKVKILVEKMRILEFEKKSFFDIMKIIKK